MTEIVETLCDDVGVEDVGEFGRGDGAGGAKFLGEDLDEEFVGEVSQGRHYFDSEGNVRE